MDSLNSLSMISIDQQDKWSSVVQRSFQYDFYHLPGYHALDDTEGEPLLLVYEEGDDFIALPLILRPVVQVPGLADLSEDWWDATSVYGYPGPIASREDIPPALVTRFQEAIKAALVERRVVTLFSRLHPIISQRSLVRGAGVYRIEGPTVSIDLTLPLEEQSSDYRKGHRYDLKRLMASDVACFEAEVGEYLDAFVDIYYETMRRVNADDFYFFSRDYFEQLLSLPELGMHLFICTHDGRPVCGGLFSLCSNIVQYHLSGTLAEARPLAPVKLMLDTVRRWASQQGASVFHLGGGVNASRDSLFRFKAGFSKRYHDFATWRWVLRPDVYQSLTSRKLRWSEARGYTGFDSQYFPRYRQRVA